MASSCGASREEALKSPMGSLLLMRRTLRAIYSSIIITVVILVEDGAATSAVIMVEAEGITSFSCNT